MEKAKVFWRRSAASVIGFARRYRSDLFLRTQINVIALQIGFAVLILLLAIGALYVLYFDIVNGFATALQTAFTATTTPISGAAVAKDLQAVRTREIVGLSVLIGCVTTVFGLVVARMTLAPARNALAAQKQFIGNIAHELRTPLAIIKTNIEVRLLDSDVPPHSRAVHNSNLEELDRISAIINNLLSLNALIQPEQVPFTNVDVGEIARRVVEKLGHLTRMKNLRVNVQAALQSAAWGNASAIEQIVMNLTRNAIAHTDKGEVSISVQPEEHGFLRLSIRDSGRGIDPKDLLHIFEPFYRGDRARTRTGGVGSGLGLAIVSELVKMHNGRIRIQSAPGKGTTVLVSLPEGRMAAPLNKDKDDDRDSEIVADFSRARNA